MVLVLLKHFVTRTILAMPLQRNHTINRRCRLLQEVLDNGITSLAVVLKHSFLFPEHEEQVGALAKSMGFTQISLSSEVMPMVKMVPRGYTAAADAYLTPHIMKYILHHTFCLVACIDTHVIGLCCCPPCI